MCFASVTAAFHTYPMTTFHEQISRYPSIIHIIFLDALASNVVAMSLSHSTQLLAAKVDRELKFSPFQNKKTVK